MAKKFVKSARFAVHRKKSTYERRRTSYAVKNTRLNSRYRVRSLSRSIGKRCSNGKIEFEWYGRFVSDGLSNYRGQDVISSDRTQIPINEFISPLVLLDRECIGTSYGSIDMQSRPRAHLVRKCVHRAHAELALAIRLFARSLSRTFF